MQLFSPFLIVLGIGAQVLALCALLSGLTGIAMNSEGSNVFFWSTLIFSGLGMLALGLGKIFQPRNLSTRHMFLTTGGTWLAISMIAVLPLYLSDLQLPFSDALFETVSGLTTTGSTMFVEIASLPPEILLWRSLLQWIGGIGVICMAVLLLPFLHVGGMRLFQTESSHWENTGNLPRTKSLVLNIIKTYVALSLLCALAYLLNGMILFDAINHAMTTVSTGGYATTEDSFIGRSNRLQWVAIIFMLAGAIPFTLYPYLAVRKTGALWQDQQVRGLLTVVAMTSLLMTGYLLSTNTLSAMDALTRSTFNLVSVITTTGYASTNYLLWGGFASAFFLLVTFIGGCSGSTSGGIKIFRFQIFSSLMRAQLARSVHPRMVVTTFYAGKPIKHEIVTAMAAYFFLMICSLAVMTLILSLANLDLVTSVSGAATALMNVGPGLGDTIGPVGNFQSLPGFAKWTLCAGMLLGRLEFLTIVILFTPSYWRG